jgi:hypothetical protein
MRGAEVMSGQHSFRLGRSRGVPPRDHPAPRRRGAGRARELTVGDAAIGAYPAWRLDVAIGPSGIGKTLLRRRSSTRGTRNGRGAAVPLVQENECRCARRQRLPATTDRADDQLTIEHIAPVEVDLIRLGPSWNAARRRDVKRVVVGQPRGARFAGATRRLPGHVGAGGPCGRPAETTIFTNEMAALGSGWRPRRALIHLQQRVLHALRPDRLDTAARTELKMRQLAREWTARVRDRPGRRRVRRVVRRCHRHVRLERAAAVSAANELASAVRGSSVVGARGGLNRARRRPGACDLRIGLSRRCDGSSPHQR